MLFLLNANWHDHWHVKIRKKQCGECTVLMWDAVHEEGETPSKLDDTNCEMFGEN